MSREERAAEMSRMVGVTVLVQAVAACPKCNDTGFIRTDEQKEAQCLDS
jgi:hypothetical protein